MSAAATLAAAPPTETGYRWRWQVLAVVLCAEIMDLVDSTIVQHRGPVGPQRPRRRRRHAAVARRRLHAHFAVFLITGARLGDIFGRRRLFLIGSAGFTLASAGCALATTPAMIIAMRVLQGAFGAVLIPQGFGMLKEVFSDEEMPKVFAAFGPVMGLSAVGGPILAGFLVDWDLWGTGWRLVFLINIPIGVRRSPAPSATSPARSPPRARASTPAAWRSSERRRSR